MSGPNSPQQPQDTHDAWAMLAWQLDAGADEAVMDAPTNWMEEAPPQKAEASAPAHPTQTDAAPRSTSPAPAQTAARPTGPVNDVIGDARSLAQQAQTLEQLEEAMRGFTACPLHKTAKNLVFCDGNPQARIMLVGEAPGRDEDLQGKPFVGKSGQLLDKMLAAIGFDRSSVFIGNCVHWRPPGNRKPTDAEKSMCLPFIERQIELVDPALLVLVGGTAAQTLLDTTEGITKMRGRWQDYSTSGGKAIPAMPVFHPAFLLRTPARKRDAWRDLLEIKQKISTLADMG